MTTDWAAEGLPADVLKGALLISGMYDLKPVRLSKRSEYVRITDEIEEALSPIRHLEQAGDAADRGVRHLRDAGVPAPESGLLRGGRGGGKAGLA